MNTESRILQDHQYLLGHLSLEENRIALECAQKVKKHLEKAFLKEQNPHYLQNIDLVEKIMEGHRQLLSSSL